MLKIVVLYLLTVNTWTGITLKSQRIEVYPRDIGSTIDFCRVAGVQLAHEANALFPNQHASTNVDCQWERPTS